MCIALHGENKEEIEGRGRGRGYEEVYMYLCPRTYHVKSSQSKEK